MVNNFLIEMKLSQETGFVEYENQILIELKRDYSE